MSRRVCSLLLSHTPTRHSRVADLITLWTHTRYTWIVAYAALHVVQGRSADSNTIQHNTTQHQQKQKRQPVARLSIVPHIVPPPNTASQPLSSYVARLELQASPRQATPSHMPFATYRNAVEVEERSARHVRRSSDQQSCPAYTAYTASRSDLKHARTGELGCGVRPAHSCSQARA
jgi:hypothetical protein